MALFTFVYSWHADENKLHSRPNFSIVCTSRPLAALISQKKRCFISAGLVFMTSVGFLQELLLQRQSFI